MAPELPVADGALGFWQAIEEIWPKTRGQHYWVHKTAKMNVHELDFRGLSL
jgi:putative transposase